ncbi:enoyl-CoA hydratase/isomerase family protein [Rhodococcus opacus]|uniref:enoyl-CoA hydratase/isomerase family protein n=1 Tax=Rhodococcus opacus TaxID=37919 RepID=UPI0024BB5516|nr:enoyl-CoA hydratase/isomerase family protein [Rhodococcus opacus]MDJ0419876.1 enoyl-CoA hydratase/isomerase family protein [Rhodococcus opacus]MDV6245265.1 enoyl-CoA hydratase/isomerase family protein [Rhodococcus opacus]
MPNAPARARPVPGNKHNIRLEHLGDGVSELTIDRYSRRNALSSRVLEEILGALDETESAGNRIVILRGASRFFSAGADVSELTGLIEDQEHDAQVATMVAALTESRLVSIAAIEGGCIGAGLELATACDLRIADSTAFFAFPALEMGLVYRPDAFARMVRLVGPAAATRMVMLGERLTLDEAYRCGLVTATTKPGEVCAAAHGLAHRLSQAPTDVLWGTARILSSALAGADKPDVWMDEHLKSFASLSRYQSVTAKKNALRKRRP